MGRLGQDDRKDLRFGFATLFVMMASHALAETARDALFLTHLEPTELPWAYLAIAVLVGVVLRGLSALRARVPDKRRLLAGTMLAAGVVYLGLGLSVHHAPERLAYGLYAWTGLVATVLILQVWLLLEDVVTVAQAKRIFGPVAAGGVLGALVGSALADRLLAMFELDPAGLLVVAGAVLALGAWMPLGWRPSHESAESAADTGRDMRADARFVEICHHVYLRRLLLVVLLSTLAFTLGDYLFKTVVAESMPAADLPAFFARYQLVLNGLALAVQLLLSGWILRTFGVSRALYVLPVVMFGAALAVVAAPVLLPVLVLKGADGALRHSLHRTATEVLYLPLSGAVRDRAKGIIDGVGQRGGQALGALALLGAAWLGADVGHLAIGLVALTAAWAMVLVGLRQPYLQLFREGLRGGEVRGRLAELDLDALESLLAALNSEIPEEVVAALDLFERYDRVALVPRVLLHHPEPVVVVRALEVFAAHGDEGFAPPARRLLTHAEPTVRVAALRALAALEDPAELYAPFLEPNPSGEPRCPALHATALVGLATESGDDDALAAEHAGELTRLLGEGSAAVREQLALAMRAHPDRRLLPALLELAAGRERVVRRAAAQAIEALARSAPFRARPRGAAAKQRQATDVRALVDALIAQLEDGVVRPAARRALVALGREALEVLDAQLARRGDAELPRRIRRHLPRTISRFPARWAVPALMRHLADEQDGAVRYKLLRGLGRLRAAHPEVGLDERFVRERIAVTLERVVALLELQVAVEAHHRASPSLGSELLLACLQEKESNALERVFRHLHLIDPGEDLEVLWRGVRSKRPRARAAALEVLAAAPVLATLERGREALLALLEEGEPTARLELAAQALGRELLPTPYPDRLAAALRDPSDTVRSFVAHHIAELDLRELAPELAAARPTREGFVAEVMDRARKALAAPLGIQKLQGLKGGHA